MGTEEDAKLRAELETFPTTKLRAIASRLPSSGWRPEAVELAERILAERGEEYAPIDGCPACGGELRAGQLSIRGTGCGFLLFGFGYKHLWFRSEEDGRSEVVQHQWAPPGAASRCSECGLILFGGDAAGR